MSRIRATSPQYHKKKIQIPPFVMLAWWLIFAATLILIVRVVTKPSAAQMLRLNVD